MGMTIEEWYFKSDKVGQPEHETALQFLKIVNELSDCCTTIRTKDMGERVHEWAKEADSERSIVSR